MTTTVVLRNAGPGDIQVSFVLEEHGPAYPEHVEEVRVLKPGEDIDGTVYKGKYIKIREF